MDAWNTTFKKPTGAQIQRPRSPSPPRAFIEPLSPSPSRPTPIEPLYNYPAVPDQTFASTPQPRSQSASQKPEHGHKRTPSTIDTLAEAALAVSPEYHAHSRKSSETYPHHAYGHAHSHSVPNGTSEPPHKRARSELLPSPLVGVYASRPATSYEHGYDRRVEEAALLVNFRTGGWPSNNAMSPPQAPAQPANRPHANSFPQASHYSRPAEEAMHAPLLPPFNPQAADGPRPTLPSPQQTVDDINASDVENGRNVGNEDAEDVLMTDTQEFTNPKAGNAVDKGPVQTQTPPDDTESRAESAELAPSEASETAKGRRGWPKGKPRSSNSKKAVLGAPKRTTARKKTPDVSRSAKKTGLELYSDLMKQSPESQRRMSLGDAPSASQAVTGTTRAQSVPQEVPMFIREVSPSKASRRQARVTSDTICAGCSTTRETAAANSEMDEWISCNGCKKWFHIDCAGFKKAHEVRDVDKHFCKACEPAHGKTTYVRKSARAHVSVDYAELQRGVLKTSEESVEHHYIQPIKDGTLFPFDQESFPRMPAEMVTQNWFERSGTFVEPICIPAELNPRPWNERAAKGMDYERAAAAGLEPDEADLLPEDPEYESVQDVGQDRLDMVMPEGLTVRQVCNLVGPETPLDVIDVKTQNSGAKWNLGRWANYYEEDGDEKAIRNVISLEVSQTKLGRLLRRPKIVRDIDLQDQVWPQEETDKGKYPKVQYYCLMSVADSYTDFHIDFGGSSVYYHILKGKKTFFFIPPKPKHLKAYEEWNESPQQNFTFLPHITKECYRVDLSEGDTMLIPSGWIHAVWTPETSLVIGGNFLTRMSYRNQFRVVEIEKANRTPMKFRYPFFQRIMWYTALQYLQTDPLPPAVSEMFYEGKTFDRETPVSQDFDGAMAADDPRPEAHNARYYSQAELDGLPDLVNYIFKTVMVVLGLVEGTSADQVKRVNASIPKGHGEPLEVAKTFALWVAWKRGREDPPNWAHPDTLLSNIKDDGQPKKLSARAIKELERKEAIAAWRIAPDRVSARVMSKHVDAGAATATNGATPTPAPPPSEHPPAQHHQQQTFAHQPHQHTPSSITPGALMMASGPGQYLSTPKTSVLGPKRVACDACRKRRIRCKHKDMVFQTSPPAFQQVNGIAPDGSYQSNLAPELHDNITVTPPKQQYMATGMDGQQDGAYAGMNGFHPNGVHGDAQPNGQGPLPGTNAYINANIPMTMNGVPIFGDVAKRGRSKACFECRKSKRRCVHDEVGNVDPVKASETPIPRGSVPSKKRSFGEDGSPMQIKKPKLNDSQPPPRSQAGTAGVLMPQHVSHGVAHPPPVRPASRPPPPVINEPPPDPQQQPEIDPSLFSVYPEPAEQGSYSNHSYPYPTTEQAQTNGYEYPSLEQIANEVLDMNGRGHEDYIDAQLNALPYQPPHNPHVNVHVYEAHDTAPMSNALAKPDESVDSAIFLPNAESMDQATSTARNRDRSVDERLMDALTADSGTGVYHGIPFVQPSVETNGTNHVEPTGPVPTFHQTLGPKNDASGLPLYRPPAPVSQSPEQTKRQPVSLVNGAVDPWAQKRKRDSTSATPGSKKARIGDHEGHASREPSVQETDDERFARLMQQEELGLRQRSK
ncbi:hypothetical protein LTR36_008502 [Oleoguttula mirabilis]|uniref:JmjC domain-containing histone demethylation protein 1 n=1 Tax=Oleoguttula mirabilis TaxID=1507867 RepID=A0AAV9JVT7_9PEZI|nr:hypothetical protein LTR36_008502 [Oleoguttula mirabilis]